MKPEILLLLQIYSSQKIAYHHILQMQSLILSKMEAYSPEQTALFQKQTLDEVASQSDEFLKRMISIFRQSFPEEMFASSETIEELLKRISLQ